MRYKNPLLSEQAVDVIIDLMGTDAIGRIEKIREIVVQTNNTSRYITPGLSYLNTDYVSSMNDILRYLDDLNSKTALLIKDNDPIHPVRAFILNQYGQIRYGTVSESEKGRKSFKKFTKHGQILAALVDKDRERLLVAAANFAINKGFKAATFLQQARPHDYNSNSWWRPGILTGGNRLFFPGITPQDLYSGVPKQASAEATLKLTANGFDKGVCVFTCISQGFKVNGRYDRKEPRMREIHRIVSERAAQAGCKRHWALIM